MSRRSRRTARQARLASAQRAQGSLARGLLANLTPKQVSEFQREMFRILRRPKTAIAFKIQELKALFKNLAPELAKTLRANRLSPGDFGCRDVRELADRLIELLAQRRVRAKTLRGFRRSVRRGYKHNINGEVFEWMVLNLAELHNDIRRWGVSQIAHLNDLRATVRALSSQQLKAANAKLLDATGKPVIDDGGFVGLELATDVWIIVGGQKRKFVDFMYVTWEVRNGARTGRLSPAVMSEIKLPAAAKGGPEQMGLAIPRMVKADGILMTIGGKPVPIDAENVIFSTASTPQSLVQAIKDVSGAAGDSRVARSYKVDEISFKSTDRAAGAGYLHVALDVAVRRVAAVTDALFVGSY